MTTAPELRSAARRAQADGVELRVLAARLERSAVHDLEHLGGDDTWVGPMATELEHAVRRARQELAWAAEDVRRRAHLLDQEAADLERAAARAEVAGVAGVAA